MRDKIEILAPAGSYEGMKAAMNAGCDAVYIGGTSFGARAFANNLEEDTLLRAIDEAHIRDKKLYLTVNTLLKEKEVTEKLYSYLEKYYLQGLDAVIVQDVGVMHFIHEHFPNLPIHASTQMTLTMAQGANLLKDSGVTRIVTSRELSLGEIKNISENTDLEIETFVHGALCYCYSGQCLMSSIIGGRSGNRGRCAQPCRMPYQYYSNNKKVSCGQEKYLLSPKDINTIELIPDLVDSGIHSFKIEGRMKRLEYAAAVSYLYRKYTDLYLELGRAGYYEILSNHEFEHDMITLQDVYNRGGFSKGYGNTYHGKEMMSLYRPNHSGVYVGKVSKIKGSQVSIQLSREVNAQDILEIRQTEEEGYEFTVKDAHLSGECLVTNVGRRSEKSFAGKPLKNSTNFKDPVIQIGELVYRTKNNELLDTLAKYYLLQDKKLGVKGELTARLGEKLKLTVTYQNFSVTVYQEEVPQALKQAMTHEKLQAPIMKTGDTLYYFEDLQIHCDNNIFVPVAWLNDLRREGLSKLEQDVTNYYRREKEELIVAKKDETLESNGKVKSFENEKMKSFENKKVISFEKENVPGFSVSVQTLQQFEIALSFGEVGRVYVDYDYLAMDTVLEMSNSTAKAGKKLYVTLPHICRLSTYQRLEKEISGIINNKNIAGFIAKNLEEITLLKSLLKTNGSDKDIILNYNMYVFNKEAKEFWRELGIRCFTAPLELNYQELKQLGISDSELLVYGYLPLMISAQCLHESTSGCKRCKNNNTGHLIDRMGKKFLLQTNCIGCYNTIYNGQPLALHKYQSEVMNLKPSALRMDFTFETAEEVEKVLQCFVDSYYNGIKNDEGFTDYTTGHFKRGVD